MRAKGRRALQKRKQAADGEWFGKVRNLSWNDLEDFISLFVLTHHFEVDGAEGDFDSC